MYNANNNVGVNMQKISRAILVVIIVMGFSLRASAQLIPTIKEVTGFGGMTFNSTDEPTAGAALAINISPRIGIEGEAGVIFASDTILNGSINIMLNLGSGTTPIVPYFIGGAGMLNNGGTDIALNAGFGLKLFVESNLALRTDFRGFFISEGGDIEDMERIYAGFIVFF